MPSDIRSQLQPRALSTSVRRWDRFATALLGLLALAGGLALVEWQAHLVWSWPQRLDTTQALDVVRTGWWPWVAAVVGVLLGLLGLRWIIAHVPRPVGRAVRTVADDAHGRSQVDLTSVATICAQRFTDLAPVVGGHGTYRRIGGEHVVEIHVGVDDRTDAAIVQEAVTKVGGELADALPSTPSHLRVMLDKPGGLLTTIPGVGPSTDDATASVDLPR